MHSTDFLHRLRQRMANLVPGPSTLRKHGKGIPDAARPFLMSIDPAIFVVADESTFSAQLDKVTLALEQHFPEGTRSWGGPRKLINLFLRDVLYNVYLCPMYRFDAIRPWLEVPLDSHVAQGLVNEEEGKGLPKWPKIKYLKAAQSSEYQQVASSVARRLNLARVDLDVIYWRAQKLGPYEPSQPLDPA
jgi:hypothetical protein